MQTSLIAGRETTNLDLRTYIVNKSDIYSFNKIKIVF